MYFDLRTKEEKKSLWLTKIPFGRAVLLILLIGGGAVWLIYSEAEDMKNEMEYSEYTIDYSFLDEISEEEVLEEEEEEEEWRFIPEPFTMDQIKTKGCVADGFLSGYGSNTKEIAKMLDRSECVYLHRALETWLRPPNFEKANEIMQKVEKRPIVYGMFLAEAVSERRSYDDPNSEYNFKFEKMCREGTKGRWGKETCIPSIQNVEYRRYLKSVTRRAMDLGIQSFLFGQIQLQDENPNFDQTEIRKVLEDMREYAKEKDMQIIIGAQTNSITDEKYLKMFDYVDGGVGIMRGGVVQSGPCHSAFSSCWALLWHDRFSKKANNVLIHLDWSGLVWDDMGVFARMEKKERTDLLETLYKKYTSKDVGFLMPFLAVLHKENGGCYGPNKNFYAPSKKFKCKDEDKINEIMRKGSQ